MNTNKAIVIIIPLVIIGAVLVYLFTSSGSMEKQSSAMEEGEVMMEKSDTTMMENDSMEKMDDSMTEEGVMMSKSGSYTTYSPDKLAMASEGKVVLFFKASWCPTCRALDANLKQNLQHIPADVTILEVDYDSATELKQRYGVTVQHTLVQVDESGNKLAMWNGSPTLDSLISKLK